MSHKFLSFVILLLMMLVFPGCSGKQYFKPKKAPISVESHSFGATIVDLSREGVTLKSGAYIGKSGISTINLGEGYRFLNENENYILAANAQGVLNIIDKRTKKSVRAVSLHMPIVSATIHNGLVAYILNNNTFGLYQISDNRKIMQNRSERTYAIDTRAASPIFIDNLAIMPMLDGKLIIIDSSNIENAKVVYISSHKYFNNVVYLSRMGNTMVAATPKRLITLGEAGKREYNVNISEVAVANQNIYLFTKEGEVIKLSEALSEVGRRKFKFAHFSAATVFAGKVFALDHQGSLIVLSEDLTKFKIYSVGSVDEAAFIAGTKLYKDGKVIDLSKLGYE